MSRTETVNLNLAHRWFIGYDLDIIFQGDTALLSKVSKKDGGEDL
jgi:hypothetical protein